jgi:microcystin degradation protein MlrC
MYTLVIAELKHETNTFSSQLTDMQSFARRRYLTGEAMISGLSGTRTETGGFLDILQKEPDVRVVPAVAADAIPAGRVTRDVFDNVLRETLKTLERLDRVDGVLLSLHGAMVTEDSEDGEGDFLEVLRNTLGAEVPIIATLDLHSNITKKMEKHAAALINFDYYSHKDMYERGGCINIRS